MDQLSERAEAHGVYEAECVGPADPADGERIADYVRQHPELIEQLEAGNANAPTYSGTRKTCEWNAASGGSKALSAALSFAFTGSGTVKGAFLVFGTGALNTIDNTAGTL